MRFLVTGSAGHLGEALMRTLRAGGRTALGVDVRPSPFTDVLASVSDREAMHAALRGIDAVIHTATLHKPHVSTHPRQAFVETNIAGTLSLLDAAAAHGVQSFVFSSSTSVFGDALVPPAGQPAAWIDESVVPVPKNIYGATKAAAEDLCQLAHRNQGLPCVVLRASRFFPEADDNPMVRDAYTDANIKVNEMLYRRVALDDVVGAHLLAVREAPRIGFGRFVISATPPFEPVDAAALRTDAPAVLGRRVPQYQAIYERLGWRMFPSLDQVYSNRRAREVLGWRPSVDFAATLDQLTSGQDTRSLLVLQIGIKGYHGEAFRDGVYPTSGAP
jgi:nucleoside-diphosphate-sugar epimerase